MVPPLDPIPADSTQQASSEGQRDPAAAFAFSSTLHGEPRDIVNRRLQAALQQHLITSLSPQPIYIIGHKADIITVTQEEADAVNNAIVREGFQHLQISDTDEKRLGLARAPGRYRPLMGTMLHPTAREEEIAEKDVEGDKFDIIRSGTTPGVVMGSFLGPEETDMTSSMASGIVAESGVEDEGNELDVDPHSAITVEPVLLAFDGTQKRCARTFVVANMTRHAVDISFSAQITTNILSSTPSFKVSFPIISTTLGPYAEVHERIIVESIAESDGNDDEEGAVQSFELLVAIGSKASPDTFSANSPDVVGRIPCVVVGRLLSPKVPGIGSILERVPTLTFCRKLANRMVSVAQQSVEETQSPGGAFRMQLRGKRVSLTFFERANITSDGWPAFAEGLQCFLYPPRICPSIAAERVFQHVARRAHPGWAWSVDELIEACAKRFGWKVGDCDEQECIPAWRMALGLATKISLTPKPYSACASDKKLTENDLIEAAIEAEGVALLNFLCGHEQGSPTRSINHSRSSRASFLRLDSRAPKEPPRQSVEPLVQQHIKALRDWAGFGELDAPLETSEDIALLEAIPPPEEPRPVFSPPFPQFERFRPYLPLVLELDIQRERNIPYPVTREEDIIALEKQKKKPHSKIPQKTKGHNFRNDEKEQQKPEVIVDFDPFTARSIGRMEVWKEVVGCWVSRLAVWFEEASCFERENDAMNMLFNELENRELHLTDGVNLSRLSSSNEGGTTAENNVSSAGDINKNEMDIILTNENEESFPDIQKDLGTK